MTLRDFGLTYNNGKMHSNMYKVMGLWNGHVVSAFLKCTCKIQAVCWINCIFYTLINLWIFLSFSLLEKKNFSFPRFLIKIQPVANERLIPFTTSNYVPSSCVKYIFSHVFIQTPPECLSMSVINKLVIWSITNTFWFYEKRLAIHSWPPRTHLKDRVPCFPSQ